jgi:hypothetical protein
MEVMGKLVNTCVRAHSLPQSTVSEWGTERREGKREKCGRLNKPRENEAQ